MRGSCKHVGTPGEHVDALRGMQSSSRGAVLLKHTPASPAPRPDRRSVREKRWPECDDLCVSVTSVSPAHAPAMKRETLRERTMSTSNLLGSAALLSRHRRNCPRS